MEKDFREEEQEEKEELGKILLSKLNE